jgi:hypothetical protein
MLPKLITLSRLRAELAKTVASGRMNPRRRRVALLLSESLELVDCVEMEEMEEVPETDRSGSSRGTAPRAKDGETLGEGEFARSDGGEAISAAISAVTVVVNCVAELLGAAHFFNQTMECHNMASPCSGGIGLLRFQENEDGGGLCPSCHLGRPGKGCLKQQRAPIGVELCQRFTHAHTPTRSSPDLRHDVASFLS